MGAKHMMTQCRTCGRRKEEPGDKICADCPNVPAPRSTTDDDLTKERNVSLNELLSRDKYIDEVVYLRAEVERLRAENRTLAGQVAAMRAALIAIREAHWGKYAGFLARDALAHTPTATERMVTAAIELADEIIDSPDCEKITKVYEYNLARALARAAARGVK
jgi:ribosomal protein L37E